MYRQITSAAVAFVLAAVANASAPIILAAQTLGPVDAVPVNPPDTVYYTGSLANDHEVERELPIAEHHRAFLPAAVDGIIAV